MRTTIRAALLLVLISSTANAAPVAKEITTLCGLTWPGDRSVQSFCIQENRNYYDWVRYIRKHSATNPKQLALVDKCVGKHQPNYRKVFDCIQEGPSLLPFF